MKKLAVIFVVLLNLLVSSVIFAGDEYSPIYPSTLAIKMDEGRNVGTFSIFNTSDEKKNYEVSVKSVDNFGKESVLSQYIKVFPKKFSLNPKDNKEIRVAIEGVPKELLGKGEYKGALLIQGIESKVNQKYENKENDKTISANITIKIDISMAIYGLSGNEVEGIEVTKFAGKDKENNEVTLKNTGNYSYEVKARLYDKNDKQIYESISVKVISGREDTYTIPKKEGAEAIEIITGDKDKKVLFKKKISEISKN